jgi:predicted transcriptional regulator
MEPGTVTSNKETAQFEQDILRMAFESDVRITTASVAYYLGIPSSQAQPLLDDLLEQGTLELNSDEDGNLYYEVADAAANQRESLSDLRRARLAGQDGSSHKGRSQTEASPGRVGFEEPSVDAVESASLDDDGGAEAFSPRQGASTRSDPSRGQTRGADPTRNQNSTHQGSSNERDGSLAGVTRRRGATDARVDSCEDHRQVVQNDARCEPKPFADPHPTLTSCMDREVGEQTAMVKSGQQQRQPAPWSTASGGTRVQQSSPRNSGGGAAIARYQEEGAMQRPEHQPGMSLLLSLILCGTGQIYNGEVSKGIMMMVLCFLLWFVLLGWVVQIWSIVDSVVVAERINRNSQPTD